MPELPDREPVSESAQDGRDRPRLAGRCEDWGVRYRWVLVDLQPASSNQEVAGSTTPANWRAVSDMNRSCTTTRSLRRSPSATRVVSANDEIMFVPNSSITVTWRSTSAPVMRCVSSASSYAASRQRSRPRSTRIRGCSSRSGFSGNLAAGLAAHAEKPAAVGGLRRRRGPRRPVAGRRRSASRRASGDSSSGTSSARPVSLTRSRRQRYAASCQPRRPRRR